MENIIKLLEDYKLINIGIKRALYEGDTQTVNEGLLLLLDNVVNLYTQIDKHIERLQFYRIILKETEEKVREAIEVEDLSEKKRKIEEIEGMYKAISSRILKKS